MTTVESILVERYDDKYISWFEPSNQWVLFEEPAWYVVDLLFDGFDNKSIVKQFIEKYGTEQSETIQFIDDIARLLENKLFIGSKQEICQTDDLLQIVDFPFFKYRHQYFADNQTFNLVFEEEWMERSIHPLFKHLLSSKSNHQQADFYLYKKGNRYVITVSTSRLRTWTFDNPQHWKGRLIVELLNLIYSKQDNDWMTLVHGSAVTDGKKTMIFTATNGGGKSTITALMQTRGFKFVSDDVVAIEGDTGLVYPFPAALSVKDGAVPVLLKHFPDLLNVQQFSFPDLNKNVRYISYPIENSVEALTKKAVAIIFVNYSTEVNFHFKKLDSIDSIQRFNQEAWISSSMGNAKRYLKWISTIPAYELTYSDTDRALETMNEIFDH